MFYVAEAFLISRQLAFSKHSAVVSTFGKEFATTGMVPAEYHGYLADAEAARKISDYNADSAMTAEDATMHLSRAESLLRIGEELLN